MKKQKKTPGEKRAELREELWPGSGSKVWSAEEDGFCSMPRTVSLVATLINELVPRMRPGPVYLDLWCRNFDEGVVEIREEKEAAASCGFTRGTRMIRSWKERIRAIEELGFIETRSKGLNDYAFILMIHPHDVVARLRRDRPADVPRWWSEIYVARLRDTGAPQRPVPE